MRRALVALILAVPLAIPTALLAQADFITLRFERYLDALRKQAHIPGLAGAIVQDDRIAWEIGQGFQDVDGRIPASPDTPFYVADLTGMLSATLLLECVEQGTVTLDETIMAPGATPDTPATPATVGALLTHSPGPGQAFRYDPSRFAALTGVIARCTDDSFKEAMGRRLLNRLAMTRSVPGQDVTATQPSDFDQDRLATYADVLTQLAKPYKVDRRGRPTPSQYPGVTMDSAYGLISTVRDLANFIMALDSLTLLREPTLAAAWSPPSGTDRAVFGLGWFVQVYNGQPVVWHFGYAPDASSGLFIHLPLRHRTLILLANSDGLSATFSLANGDLTTSPFARLFLSIFG